MSPELCLSLPQQYGVCRHNYTQSRSELCASLLCRRMSYICLRKPEDSLGYISAAFSTWFSEEVSHRDLLLIRLCHLCLTQQGHYRFVSKAGSREPGLPKDPESPSLAEVYLQPNSQCSSWPADQLLPTQQSWHGQLSIKKAAG